jgi:hypothetical protein
MSESSTIFVGLDQHKESIAVAGVGADRCLEPIYLGSIGTRTSEIDATVRKLQSKGEKLVFALPSQVPAHDSGSGWFAIPSQCRTPTGRTSSVSRRTKADWKSAHLRWLGEVRCATSAQQVVFQEYVRAMAQCFERVGRLEVELAEHVKSWRLSPVVEALQALRGVRFTVAVTAIAELGDLTRFAKPRQLMSFLGLHPSEHTSGDKRRLGGIAKTANSHARRALVEGAWAYRFPARVSKQIQARQQNLPEPVRDIAWRAQVRLCKRFQKMIARGKNANRRGHRDRPRTGRLHVGHRQTGADSGLDNGPTTKRLRNAQCSGIGRGRGPGFGATLGLCSAQTVTDRIVGYNAWFDRLCLLKSLGNPYLDDRLPCDAESLCLFIQ